MIASGPAGTYYCMGKGHRDQRLESEDGKHEHAEHE